MEWPEKLRAMLKSKATNRAMAERQAGLARNRIGQMEAGHEPGVLDAIKLCRFLDMTVEELFGPDAVVTKAATPRQAAQKALGESLDRVSGRASERPASAKARGKGRKTG